MENEIKLLTRSEVAEIFKVSHHTIKKWEKQGKLQNHAPKGTRKPLYVKSEVLSTLTSKDHG